MTTAQQQQNRRRSMSLSYKASPFLSQSDTTTSSSSLWNNNKPTTKSYFLSRFNKSSTSIPPPVSTPSSSTSTNLFAATNTLPPIGQQQKIKRKPVVGGPNSPTTPTFSTTTRKKYEAVLGIKNEELDTKKSHNGSSKGFGNLFKKKTSKSTIKNINPPHSSGTTDSLYFNTTTPQQENNKIELLPPLLHHQQQQAVIPASTVTAVEPLVVAPAVVAAAPVNLPNYKPQYHQYQVKEQPSLAFKQQQQQQQLQQQLQQQAAINNNNTVVPPSRLSIASIRKSTGSYSIYSTFGSESIYGENESAETVNTTAVNSVVGDIKEEEEEEKKEMKETNVVDLAHIVANNVQTRTPARIVQISDDEAEEEEEEEEEEDDEDDAESEIGDNAFVDATGMSQEDMERERIESRLSKRLSGGHFGSAGGLMMSIMASENDTTKKQKRTSRPPPEDVVKAMINWKRQSGGQALGKFLLEQQQQAEQPPAVPEKDALFLQQQQQPIIILSSSSPTTTTSLPPPPQRPLPPNPEILLSTTEEVEEEEQEEALVLKQQQPEQYKDEKKDDEPTTPNDSTEVVVNDDPKECASRLWHEDETFVQRERIAEWLGQSKPLNTNTLNEYMDYFDFATMRLDSAFRKVCSKLYFRAEAQQIDRILEAFAKRYWQCNPKTIFGSADTVYAVVYSLLLLNTDLHVAQGSYTRMTRQAFVKNTMSTIRDQLKASPNTKPKSASYMMAWEAHIEAYLKDMYISVKNYQILQPLQNQQQNGDDNLLGPMPTSTVSKRMSMMGGKRMIDIKRSLNTMIHKSNSTRESMLFSDEPSPRKSTSSSTTATLPRRINTRRESFSSTHSGHSLTLTNTNNTGTSKSQHGALLSPNQSHMMSFMDTHAADLFANQPPYLKEGVVMRKHLLESANQKAKHREWRECLLVVGQGELKMYGLQLEENSYANASSTRKNMIRASSASFANLADSLAKNCSSATHSATNISTSNSFGGVSQNGNHRWAAYSQLLGSIELNHTLSNALPPPGYNRTRPYVFAIQEPNGGVYLFQAASQEQIQEWTNCCNYGAAIKSKTPLQGGVSNIEYGWGSCLDDVILDLDAVESGKKITGKYFNDPDAVHVSTWVPPAPTMVSSVLDEKAHYDDLQKYLDSLNEEINEHREIKKKILVKFPQKSQNHAKALSNWEAKSKYMLHEIIKYQNYCDVLEKSILRREEEEKRAAEEGSDEQQ